MFKFNAPVKMLYKSKAEQQILDNLNKYIDENSDEPVRLVEGFWNDQVNNMSYNDIRRWIDEEGFDQDDWDEWIHRYTEFFVEHFVPVWMAAAGAGGKAQILTKDIKGFAFDPGSKAIRRWVSERCGNLITEITETQRKAVKAMVGRAVDGAYTVDELSKIIRPCIGLTDRQANSVQRYYETIRDDMIKNHPRMKVETAQEKARERAVKYAQKKHRARAYDIAITELASAYNEGNAEAVYQAQREGYLGETRRIGSCAMDERTCGACIFREGMDIPPEDGNPPWHPRCRCAIMYVTTGFPYTADNTEEQSEYIPIDDTITDEAYTVINSDFEEIPEKHKNILEKELTEVRRSPVGYSYYDRRLKIIYLDDELERGEFIHEAAHFLEDHYKIFKRKDYLEILKDSLQGNRIIYDKDTFVKPCFRVKSEKLVSPYQGRAYVEGGRKPYDKNMNPDPYVFQEFFSEGYKYYVTNPSLLRRRNFKLYKFIGDLVNGDKT